MAKQFKDVVALGDLHFPFHCQYALGFAIDYIKQTKPKVIVQLGDLYDLLSLSKFPSRLYYKFREEAPEAREIAEDFWDLVKKASPKSKLFQIKGNHDLRSEKRMIEYLNGALEQTYEQKPLWTFNGVETIDDAKDDLIIDDVVYMHGYRNKLGDHLKHNNFKNTVCGHTHRPGVYYHRLDTGRISWEANAGYLGNPFSEGLNYRMQRKFFIWVKALCHVKKFGPVIVPFNV